MKLLAVFLLLKIPFTLCGLFWFHINSWATFSKSMKSNITSLIYIILNLWINSDSICNCTKQVLLVQEHRKMFPSSSIFCYFHFCLFYFCFYIPTNVSPLTFPPTSLLPHPLLLPCFSSKKAGFSWISTSHSISSCSVTRHLLFY